MTKRGLVNISLKKKTLRQAVAGISLKMDKKAFTVLKKGHRIKGGILQTAQVAGLMAVKSTPQIIAHCHPIALTDIQFTFKKNEKQSRLDIRTKVCCIDRTGAEMEALCGAMVAALTVYDMLKKIDAKIIIRDLKLIEKTGGRSGVFKR